MGADRLDIDAHIWGESAPNAWLLDRFGLTAEGLPTGCGGQSRPSLVQPPEENR